MTRVLTRAVCVLGAVFALSGRQQRSRACPLSAVGIAGRAVADLDVKWPPSLSDPAAAPFSGLSGGEYQ